jgi:hypothetical protein
MCSNSDDKYTVLAVLGNIHPVTRSVDVEVEEMRELVVQEGLSFDVAPKRSYFRP